MRTKGLIVASPDHALWKNYIKATIDKSQGDSKCKICNRGNETFQPHCKRVHEIGAEKLLESNDNDTRTIQDIGIYRDCGFKQNKKWYDHLPEVVLVNDDCISCFGTSVHKQIMKLRLEDQTW